MTTASLDNSCDSELNKCITWQFDNAEHLVATINLLKDFFNQSTESLWEDWVSAVADIDTADDFGLSIWGKLLNCRRPVLTIGTTTSLLSKELYRKILKARFGLLGSNASVAAYCDYVYAIFGGKMTVTDGLQMNLTFTGSSLTNEQSALVAQAPDVVFVYPSGVTNNTVCDKIAFGYCGTKSGARPTSWDGIFKDGTIKKMDDKSATLIWR